MSQPAEIMSSPMSANEKLSAHFKDHGLSVETLVTKEHSSLHKTGFPIGSSVGILHFKPEGKANPKRSKLSNTLLFGIEGFQRLFDQIDQNQIGSPDYLYGQTSEKMARQAQILGFSIRKDKLFGIPFLDALGISGGPYEIAAETDLVRRKLDELLKKKYPGGRTILDVLRERSTSQPSPKHLFRRLLASLSINRKPPKNQ